MGIATWQRPTPYVGQVSEEASKQRRDAEHVTPIVSQAQRPQVQADCDKRVVVQATDGAREIMVERGDIQKRSASVHRTKAPTFFAVLHDVPGLKDEAESQGHRSER